MNILLLRGFNNYFNRVVKKYSTLDDYRNNSASYLDLASINFNPNDGVATELVIGSVNQVENNAPLAWDEIGTPDYCICYENNEIKFRWFVLESERTRKGQYRIALKRDSVADFYNEILTAPCFVEKGNISDVNNPLLLNPENMSFNQIKQAETPLIDESGSAWLVGYIKKGLAQKSVTEVMSKDLVNASDYSSLFFKDYIDYDDDALTPTGDLIVPSSLGMKFMTRPSNGTQHMKFSVDLSDSTQDNYSYVGFETPNIGSTVLWEGINNYFLTYGTNNSRVPDSVGPFLANSWTSATANIPAATRTSFKNLLRNRLKTNNSLQEVRELDASETYASLISKYNGALIVKNGVYYKLNIYIESQIRTASDYVDYQTNSIIGTYADYLVDVSSLLSKHETTTATEKVKSELTYQKIIIQALQQDTSEGAITFTLPAAETDRITTDDALYDIFAIPYIPAQYSATRSAYFYDQLGGRHKVNSDAMLFIAQKMMTELNMGQTSAEAYDLQILPYCPIIMPENNDLRDLDSKSYSIITISHEVQGHPVNISIGYAIFAPNANFSKNISIRREINTSSALDVKVSNECDFMRLTSPNWNSMFEFKLSKFKDGIHLINVDCSYKPITPYIKLNPDFSYLYGVDWNDSTGLILSGDFSLPVMNDAWINYQLNNKNYQATFNRQIQNLDVNNQIAMEQQQFNAAIGVLTGGLGGATTGAIAGLKAGGPYGAAAGAAIGLTAGTALSSIGAGKDIEWLTRAQSEARSYAQDQFSYQLGNIKALPQTISKSDPLTYNNKIWPILEEFSCTDIEKQLLRSKIEYNGMNIMAIGTIDTYCHSNDLDKVFVKGQLIRLEDIVDDFHVADAIYQEVNKGIYIIQ